MIGNTLKNQHLKGDPFNSAYREKFGWEDIGFNRTYETMVFKVKGSTPEQCLACPWVIKVSEDVESLSYNDAADAYKGHRALCRKWAAKK